MKNGLLRFIPLQADLCLNKQKVDIEEFKGWQKCNAPVYGGCLSPLYKKEGDHHDIYKGDDYYDWSSGTLSKNGVAVLSGSGSKKLKKTKVNEDYSAMAVGEDGKLTWIKETSATTVSVSLNGASASSTTIYECAKIICTKAFANQTLGMCGVVVLFLNTSGKYQAFIKWNDGGDHYEYGTAWDSFNVVSPLIQVGVMDSKKMLISFFGTSGTNLSDVDVKNIYVDNTTLHMNPTFESSSSFPTSYYTYSQNGGCGIKFETYQLVSQDIPTATTVGYGVRQTLTISVKAHPSPIKIDLYNRDELVETLTFPANANDETYTRIIVAWYTNNLMSATISCTNANGTVTGTQSGVTSLAIPKTSNDYTDKATLSMYNTYMRKNEYAYTMVKAVVKLPKLLHPNDSSEPQSYSTTDYDTYLMTLSMSGSALLGEVARGAIGMSNYSYVTGSLTSELAISLLLIGSGTGWSAVNDYSGNNAKTSGGTLLYSGYAGVFTTLSDGSQFFYNNGGATPNMAGYYYSGGLPIMYFMKGKSPITSSTIVIKQADCCMDDGNLYCAKNITSDKENALQPAYISLSGTFSSYDSVTNTISYVSTGTLKIAYDSEDENVFPKYYEGMNISIQDHYMRAIYLFRAKKESTDYINIMVDSLALAEGETALHLMAGVQKGTNANLQGGVKNTTSTQGWRLLFNNNMLSNIGCYEDKGYIGTILADWFTVDGDFGITYNADTLYYKDNSKTLWKLEMVNSGQEWEYRYVEDRYFVLNTTNYFNCYDTKTGLKRHWASDYNNRIIYGESFTSFTNSDKFRAILSGEMFEGLIITSQNANYEVTQDTITGLELGAIIYEKCYKDNMAFISCGMPYDAVESIDLYRGDDGSTAALYVCSFANGVKFINNDLTNPYAVYPISSDGNVRYNPNLFTLFLKSYNNKDMVISDGIAYKLIYYNNVVPVMAYYLLDGVEELLGAFVLQTSYYGVSESRLYQMNYSNGVGVEVVADITGLEYLGALPSQALFWSAQNRAIYSFRGDCIMSLMQYANEITSIYGKWYNPATQELFLDTNIGILVFSDLGTYCLEWTLETNTKSVSDIFFFKDKFLVNLVNDTSHTYYYSYNKLEGYASNKIYIVTKYYGNGLVPITINNVYIRLYNQATQNAEGTIVFKGHTITDIGTETDTKTINIGGENGEAWDSLTDTMLVKYTPQYNRGLGFALEVETTFPIIDIKFDYVENGAIESQVAHINI